MNAKMKYREELLNLSKDLTLSKLKELVDFIKFLKVQEKEFSYREIEDPTRYVQEIRAKETLEMKSGEEFIQELIRWQELNCL